MQSRERQRGQAAIMATISLVVIFGLLGLVVDVGWAYWRREACKTAAEAAVVAAGMAASSASSFTCGSGVTCQSATACPSSLTPASNPINAACLYAQQNGFTNGANGGKQSVKIAAGVSANPVPGISPSYWITASVSETIPTTFSAILGQMNMSSVANATAGVFSTPGGGCIYILEPTNTGLQMSGGSISSNCGIYINSNSSTAILQSGGTVTVSGGKQVYNHGSWLHSGGTITPAPIAGSVQADPFAALPDPSTAGACVDAGQSWSSGTHTLLAGKHCGSVSISGGTITVAAGMHVFTSGFNISGGTVADDATTGVTFYFDGGGLNMSGSTITLRPPTTGTYKGITVFYKRTNTSAINMSGGGLNLTGAVYAAGSTNNVSGGNYTNSTFVVKQWVTSGGTAATLNGVASTNYSGSTTVSLLL